jgi:hypothetical protein
MNFANPGFLFALFAVLIPIVIHLFHFRKFTKIYFSNVTFLANIKAQNATKNKLKNRLILLARVLAVSFLVLAFARPIFNSSADNTANRSAQVSIYVDNSYSMGEVSTNGSLLDEAKRNALAIVSSYPLNTYFQLITNDFEGRHQRFVHADAFKNMLSEVKISANSRNLQQVINRQSAANKQPLDNSLYILSDFQQNFVGNSKIQTPAQTAIHLLRLPAGNSANLSIDSLWFSSPVQYQSSSTAQLLVRLRNFGADDASHIPLKLNINQQQKALRMVNVKANSTQVDTLHVGGLTAGWQKAFIQLQDFPFTFDDKLYFSFELKTKQRILSINGANAADNLKAAFGADAYFELTEMPEGAINYMQLPNYSLVILNSLSQTSSGLEQALKKQMEAGGSVLIFPNTKQNPTDFSQFLSSIGLNISAKLQTDTVKVSSIDLKNPLFKGVFDEFPNQISLPQIQRYFAYSQASKQLQIPLINLPHNHFLLARFQHSASSIYLAASGLSAADGNWAKHPIFLPTLYKIALASQQDFPLYYQTGTDTRIEIPSVTLAKNQQVKVVKGDFMAIPELSQNAGKAHLYLADQIKQAGQYDLKLGDSILAVLSFNDDRHESMLRYATDDELVAKFAEHPIKLIDIKKQNISSGLSLEKNGTELWKLCLILTLIFILAEILVVKFYKPTKIQKT